MKPFSRFDLYELVRDGTTVTGAQLALLNTIAWRANPKDNYSCFLGTELLVRETHYTEQNLRIAAKKLQEVGLIKRVKRSKRSTLFFLNVPKLMELAKVVRDAETAESDEGFDPFNTNGIQQAEPDEDDNTDGLEVDPANELAPETKTMQKLLRVVRTIWPDHPSLANEHLLMRDLEECVRNVGGLQRCSDLLFYLQASDDEAWQQVADSRMLGRYLAKMVSVWEPTCAHKLAPPTSTNEDECEPER
jgi:hypothetical protein